MRPSSIKLLNKYVAENSEVFETDGELLFCKVCNMAVDCDTESVVEQHLLAENHLEKWAEVNEPEKLVSVDLLNKYVSENNKVFETDGQVLFCNACNTIVSCNKQTLVDQHLRSQEHIENYKEMVETPSSITNKELLSKYVLENIDVYETDGKELFCKICKISVSFDKKITVNHHLRSEKHMDKYKKMIETQKAKKTRQLLSKYVAENRKVFKTDGKELFCKICKKSVSFERKFLVKRHLNTKKHQKFLTINDGQKAENVVQEDKLWSKDILNKYVTENAEVFETDGEMLFCKVCKKSVSFEKKFLVDQHIKTQKHKDQFAECFGIAAQGLNSSKDLLKSNRSPGKQSAAKLLKKYVSENDEVFETDGEVLFCKVCTKSVSFHKKYSVDQHLKTQKHKDNFAQSIGKAAQDVCSTDISEKKDQFILEMNEDLCRTCMKQFSKTNRNDDGKQNITEIPTGYQNNTSIMELLEIIQPQIKIEIKSNLPTLICSDCIRKLLVSYEFIEMYRNVDKKLRKMLEEFDIENCKLNSDEQPEFLNEMEVQNNFEDTKYEIEIAEINIDDLEKEQDDEIRDNDLSEIEENSSSKDAVYSNENDFSADSEDDWIPKKSWLNVSSKKQNSDNATNSPKIKKEIKEISQPDQFDEFDDDESLQCQQCESIFDNLKLLREHIRQNHNEKKTKRAYNKRTNEPRRKATQRVTRKIPPKQEGGYQCEHCKKRYSSYIFYRTHMRLHTVEPHLCIECGKSFTRLSSFNTHMLRHKGEKNYQCPHCPRSFVCSSGLYGHMMVHTNNKPYVCHICGAAFHMAYQLRHHNLYHAGIKKFQCEYCDMRFVTREKQRRHMRTHTGEKPYRCKYCERAFAQSNDCVKHLRQHLGDNVYQCDLCPLRFPLVRDLRVHFATHKDDDEETRARNLQARADEERNLQIKLGSTEVV